jgi:Tfp pilus assembly protein PilX
MKMLLPQLARASVKLVRNQHGASILAVIFVMLVLTSIGYTFSLMMAAKQESVSSTLDAGMSFYMAEAGMNYAGKYLDGLADWTTAATQAKSLGGGSFSAAFSSYDAGPPETIIAESTGTYNTGTRVIKSTFER